MMKDEQPGMVLLVEDDPDAADMYALSLNLCGYPVRVARSPEAGLAQVADGAPPKLIVLDLGLVKLSGFEMLMLLRQSPSTASMPVIVLSNHVVDFPEAYKRGATECLAKHSTTPGDLAMHVRTVVGQPRSDWASARQEPNRSQNSTELDPEQVAADRLLKEAEEKAKIVSALNLAQRQHQAELTAATAERAWANQQRSRANRALANAEHNVGTDELISRAKAELYGGWAQMHTERARAHECRAARQFREAALHDRNADAQGARLLGAVERLYAARH
jgi:DNA-binding response OmpR family regulator